MAARFCGVSRIDGATALTRMPSPATSSPSAWVIAAAQVGTHEDGRSTWGHSLLVDPWGDVVLDMGGEMAGLGFAEIDPVRTASVRGQLPSLANRRNIAI